MNFSLDELKVSVEVIRRFGCVENVLNKIIEIEIERLNEKIKNHTIEAESVDKFKRIVEEILLDEIEESTPHGEYGCDSIEGDFYWNGNTYEAYLEPFWNRHDKQYYYVDGVEVFRIENKITGEEI